MTFADELSKLKKVLRFRKMPDGKTCTVSSLEAAPPRYVCMSVCLSVCLDNVSECLSKCFMHKKCACGWGCSEDDMKQALKHTECLNTCISQVRGFLMRK